MTTHKKISTTLSNKKNSFKNLLLFPPQVLKYSGGPKSLLYHYWITTTYRSRERERFCILIRQHREAARGEGRAGKGRHEQGFEDKKRWIQQEVKVQMDLEMRRRV